MRASLDEKKREAASAKARGKDTEAEQAKYPPSKSKGRAKGPPGRQLQTQLKVHQR